MRILLARRFGEDSLATKRRQSPFEFEFEERRSGRGSQQTPFLFVLTSCLYEPLLNW